MTKKKMKVTHQQKPGCPWFGLILLPVEDPHKGGVATFAKILDKAHANSADVLYWSQDRKAVAARANEPDLRDRVTIVIEQDWDPRAFTLKREFKPDIDRQLKGLRVLDAPDGDGGQS